MGVSQGCHRGGIHSEANMYFETERGRRQRRDAGLWLRRLPGPRGPEMVCDGSGANDRDGLHAEGPAL
jgi:hypothetical protein